MLKASVHVPYNQVSSVNQATSASESLQRECQVYVERINNLLGKSKRLSAKIPIRPSDDSDYCDALLESLRDGVLLSHIIDNLKPNPSLLSSIHYSIDLTRMGKQHSKAIFEVGENLNKVVEAAKTLRGIGVVLVNIGANDILNKNVDIVLGLVWQLVRAHLLRRVNLVDCPALIRLLEHGESLKDLISHSPETILIRWFNYHLKRAGSAPIANLSADAASGQNYIVLLKRVCPPSTDFALLDKALASSLDEQRAEFILEFCEELECRDYVTSRDIVSGNARLNLAFVSGIFNRYIGIFLPSDDELRQLYGQIDSLTIENGRLLQLIADKDCQLDKKCADIENVKSQMASQHDAHQQEMARRLEKMREEESVKNAENNAEHQLEMDRLKSKLDADVQRREVEHKAIIESVKAKSKQQMYIMEREMLGQRQKIAKDLLSLKNSLESFFIEEQMDVPETSSGQGSELESIPKELQDKMTFMMKEYHNKVEYCAELEKKVQRLRQMNDVYGDKIQEYAESKIQEERRNTRNVKGFFGGSK